MIPSPIVRSMNSGYFDYCPTCSVQLNGIGDYRICTECSEQPLELKTPGTLTLVGNSTRTKPSNSVKHSDSMKHQRSTRGTRPVRASNSIKHSASVRHRNSKRQPKPSTHRLTSRNLAHLDSVNRHKKNREPPPMEGTVELQVIHTGAEIYKKPLEKQTTSDEPVLIHPAPTRRLRNKKKHQPSPEELLQRERHHQGLATPADGDVDNVLRVRIKKLRIGGKSLGKLFKGKSAIERF